MGSVWGIAGLVVFVASVSGCQSEGDGSLKGAAGPGSSAWKDEDNVQCQADTDCGAGETCTNNVCQMKRCGEPNYKSIAPLGTVGYFKRDREIIVAESVSIPGATLAGYDPQGSAFTKSSAPWTNATAAVVDVAGGNFTGSRPESVAMITSGSKNIVVKAKAGDITIPLTFVPVAIAGGDINGDGQDEILALSETGTVAACSATTKECRSITASLPVRATDIAAGDLDGDGFAEAVVLAGNSLGVVNFDTEKTGHKKTYSSTTPSTLIRIAMGDLDGDGKDDLIGLEDSYGEEEIYVVDVHDGSEASFRVTGNVASGARDIAVGAIGTDKMMIAVLGSDKTVEMISFNNGVFASAYKSVLEGTSSPTHITLADVDGDSPTRSLKGEAKLVPGTVIPIAVLTLPPYSRTYSEGESSASVGATENKEEGITKTIILGANVGISFGGDIGPIVSAEVSASVSRESWEQSGKTKGIAIGGSFEVEAKPDKDGYASGAVMLGCACYHQYQYVIDDPKGVLGNDRNGKTIDVFVPVGGQTSVWSTRRYNALAAALKTLPKITVPHKLGQVDSYPSTPKTLDGAPIPAEDMLFTKPPTFRTSDVAGVDFEMTASEGETQDKNLYNGVTLGAQIGAFGVTVTGEVNMSIGNGYTLSVSRDASFSGHVPPVRNDPETPEDEFGLYGYSFTPIVYRHRYMDADKKAAAFYVLTYAVGK